MHRTRRLGLLSFVPLGAVVAFVAVAFLLMGAVATDTGSTPFVSIPVAFGLVVVGLVASIFVYIRSSSTSRGGVTSVLRTRRCGSS
jgi:amino acid transporter